MALTFSKRIICDSKVLGGKPVVKGTRISVEHILELIRSGMNFEQILAEYRHLERADLEAVMAFAKSAVSHREIVSFESSRVSV